ncbi:hypothetical protein AAFC00_001141 [Neodothiora populina]|uniref:dCMP deaminase n=1 Tax=Neodothiora populina TaxID=2781224 RepID=A0ABR3PNY0_9PEZI
MLIGICGAICAGKQSVANYLIQTHDFTPLSMKRPSPTPAIEKSADLCDVPSSTPSSSPATTSATTITTATPQPIEFENVNALDEHVSRDWRTNFVLTTIWNESILDHLQKRPYFIFMSIDAPTGLRWQRFRARCAQHNQEAPTLEDFVIRSDEHVYDTTNNGSSAGSASLVALSARAQIRIVNSASEMSTLNASLEALNLLDPARLRPTWDQYFMQLADLAARRSNCMRRQVGCVLVREKRVISTGYNGTPRNVTNCNDGGCPRCNTSIGRGGAALSTCLCLHAEENALLEAGRERIGDAAVLYCNTCPCLTCSVKIVQVGITEVVFSQSYHMDVESAKIFQQAGVRLRQFSPPREGLVNLC